MDALQELKLPEEMKDQDSSDEEEDFNPFQFSQTDDTFHSHERVFQNHFEVKDKKWILVPREKIRLIKQGWRRVKKWVGIIKEEHSILMKAREEFCEMKRKSSLFVEVLAKTEETANLKCQTLEAEILKYRTDSQQIIDYYIEEFTTLKEAAHEREQVIAKQARSIKHLIEDETLLYEKRTILNNEILGLKKELSLIKTIKNIGYIELNPQQPQKQPFSTFELLLNSQVKDKITKFLTIKDILVLILSSKALYLSFGVPKVIVPIGVRAMMSKLRREMEIMRIKDNVYNDLLSSAPPEWVRTSMIKVFEMKVNMTEFLSPALKETQNLIDGQQFIGATSIKTENSVSDNIESFLKDQKGLYEHSLRSLTNSQFPWKDFFSEVVDRSLNERSKQHMQLHGQSQIIAFRLFELGGICSNDSGLFSMYQSQLQKNVAQLFVFAQHLTLEVQQLQAMVYFVMRSYLDNSRKQRQQQGELDDVQQKLTVYRQARDYLNSRVGDAERQISNYQDQVLLQSQQLLQKDSIISKLNDQKYELEKQNTKQNETLKQLAMKVMLYKNKFNENVNSYNELLDQFQSISQNVGEIVYKY